MSYLSFRNGKTDGTSVASGFVGEQITTTMASNTTALSTSLSVSLTAGIWLLFGSVKIQNNNYIGGGFSTSSSSFDSNYYKCGQCVAVTDEANTESIMLTPNPRLVNISTTTTYYLFLQSASTTAGSIIWQAGTYIQAVRIA